MAGGSDTISRKAITVSGPVRNDGTDKLDTILIRNPYMRDIYPTPENRTGQEVFYLYKGEGDFFDLTTQPKTRDRFVFGGKAL